MATSSEHKDLLLILQQQLQQQQQQYEQQQAQHQQQMAVITDILQKHVLTSEEKHSSIPKFESFDSLSELWKEYHSRFMTFCRAQSVPDAKLAQVFLTNQTPTIYKLLTNLASQSNPPKEIHELSFPEIVAYMKDQYDARKFVVRERFKFWTTMKRKPGETIHELALRIRQNATTCDFTSIKDPLDEAMRTCLICTINNEAVLKSLFKVKEDELSFARAIDIACEVEEAAQVAKDTVHGNTIYGSQNMVHKVKTSGGNSSRSKIHNKRQEERTPNKGGQPTNYGKCFTCGKTNHRRDTCRFRNSSCSYCKQKGHLESACFKKRNNTRVQSVTKFAVTSVNHDCSKKLRAILTFNDKQFFFEIDTGSVDNFISKAYWKSLGSPVLRANENAYESASTHSIPILGICSLRTSCVNVPNSNSRNEQVLDFTVSDLDNLNLLGLKGISSLGLSLDSFLQKPQVNSHHSNSDRASNVTNKVARNLFIDKSFQAKCKLLCNKFPNLWKEELGCLKDYELTVKFKDDAKPIFLKPRTVPFAIQNDLTQAIDAGIVKGVWEKVNFSEYGTPVVPVKKRSVGVNGRPVIRVCGDYSATVNSQLEKHRHPMPTPESLIQKLGGGYCFTKIDLADAYSQIMLSPESQHKLALSTHRGVLLQKRLPFGITSAPGYFQSVMEKVTADLTGVGVYLDDILVSGNDAADHLRNLENLLQRLDERGLRCRLNKCSFAEPSVEYLGHVLSKDGIRKGSRVDAIQKMPRPTDVSTLRSFLGSIQFYSKFISNVAMITEPLYKLTRKGVPWKWGDEQEKSFKLLKEKLLEETVLVHFNPNDELGISCDASSIGVGAVLFHRYKDGTERPIANVSKILTSAQRNYSQIQKEALAIVFAMKKFHQFLYGRKFYLVTDHKPLLSLFGQQKATPALAANRLARWALTISQYDYIIEYRKTQEHGNADALSRLPAGTDSDFDASEESDDEYSVCSVNNISSQLNLPSKGIVQATAKDPILALVVKFVREGWPNTNSPSNSIHCYEAINQFKSIRNSLLVFEGCLFYGSRLVIPQSLRKEVLKILHMGHFGIVRMKMLARSAVFWPNIDADVEDTARNCDACAQHQNKPEKPLTHPWIIPEKPWIRLHLDHAVNFMGYNWLVITDAYSKYPCIHATNSTSTRTTTDILEEVFAHFGFPVSVVTDNATTFSSYEFKTWCEERGIIHLSGAPYYPASNGAAERLVQSFKQSLRKSKLPPKSALQEFLMAYRRTTLPSGLSPSELLNNRQIRSKIDILKPSAAAVLQKQQARQLSNEEKRRHASSKVDKVDYYYKNGTPCFAACYWRRNDKDPRWVPATVIKVFGSRNFQVQVYPTGPIWKRHVTQLRPRYGADEDADPGDDVTGIGSTSTRYYTPATSVANENQRPAPRLRRNRRGPRRKSRVPRVPLRRSERLRTARQTCTEC